MRTRFLRGDTTQNNGLTLPNGELSIDLEKRALRLHDGSTLGCFEILGTQAYVPPGSTIIAGDELTGFYGEIVGSDFITYSSLSYQVGLSAGTLQHDAESAWLKFSLDGRVVYVAKKPIRHTITAREINDQHLTVENSSTSTVTVNDNVFKVTLLTGGDTNPASSPGGEWNRLMYPIHIDDPDGLEWGINYTNGDLSIGEGDGRATWTSASETDTYGDRIFRGHSSLTAFSSVRTDYAVAVHGWRPVLRSVE